MGPPTVLTVGLARPKALLITVTHSASQHLRAVLICFVVAAASTIAIVEGSVVVVAPLLEAQLIATRLLEIPLLISQLGTASLLFEQTLALPREALSTLQLLPIARYPLLLILLPVALPRIVVAIVIGAIVIGAIAALLSASTFPMLAPLLSTRGVLLLLLEPTSLFRVAVGLLLRLVLRPLRTLLRLTYLLLSLLLRALALLILALDIATLFMRLRFALSLLFSALLALLAVLLLLLGTTLGLLPTLLSNRLCAFGLLRLLRWLGCLPFAPVLPRALSYSLFLLGRVLLAPILTSTTSSLSTDTVGGTQ
jgi:hypothetical protein